MATIEHSGLNFQEVDIDLKKASFTGIANMTLITPSKWLESLVQNSFLSEYPVKVHYNTIDTNVFKPTNGNFRDRYKIGNKRMVLAVSNAWQEPRKGLNDVYQIGKKLDSNVVMVVVGLNEELMRSLPDGIIGITKTSNLTELAEIYTAADVLINPTYEDNYPTVNLEAQACGTPVITYRTGGSPESVPDENVIEVGNIDKMCQRIIELTTRSR